MTHDAVLRTAAVVAATALLASPHWGQCVRYLAKAAEAAKPYRTTAARAAAACLLIFALRGSGLVPAAVTPAGVVTALKVVIGCGCIGYGFSELVRAFVAKGIPA